MHNGQQLKMKIKEKEHKVGSSVQFKSGLISWFSLLNSFPLKVSRRNSCCYGKQIYFK